MLIMWKNTPKPLSFLFVVFSSLSRFNTPCNKIPDCEACLLMLNTDQEQTSLFKL